MRARSPIPTSAASTTSEKSRGATFSRWSTSTGRTWPLFCGASGAWAATLAEWRHKHSQEPPTAPSTVTPGLDPVVERAILRCLEKDPGQRPRSAAAVAAALPGGDPLAAAIAAGDTPSPEMVAAAGSDEGMKPAAAWACLVSILAGLALAAYLSPRA